MISEVTVVKTGIKEPGLRTGEANQQLSALVALAEDPRFNY